MNIAINTAAKSYAKISVANMQAGKASKKTGIKHIVFATEAGFSVATEAQYAAYAAEKMAQALKDTAPVVVRNADKTNVVGRASSGAWLKQVTTYLRENNMDKATAFTHSDEKGRIWIGDAKNANRFWMKSLARVEAVMAAL